MDQRARRWRCARAKSLRASRQRHRFLRGINCWIPALELFVETAFRIRSVFVLTGRSPSFVPEMNRVGMFIKLERNLRLQHSLPVSITVRAKHFGRLFVSLE